MSSSFRLRYNAYMKARKRSVTTTNILSFLVLAMCFCPAVWYILDRDSTTLWQLLWSVVQMFVFTLLSLGVAGFFHFVIGRLLLRCSYAKEMKKQLNH